MTSYDEVKEAAIEAIGGTTNDEWAKFIGRNAVDFYRLS